MAEKESYGFDASWAPKRTSDCYQWMKVMSYIQETGMRQLGIDQDKWRDLAKRWDEINDAVESSRANRVACRR